MSRPDTSFFSFHKRTLLALIFLSVFSLTVVYAAPRVSQFTPGETLDPDCAPGESNCSVEIPVGGGGSPSGPDYALQWNDGGSFGGNGQLIFDPYENLRIGGDGIQPFDSGVSENAIAFGKGVDSGILEYNSYALVHGYAEGTGSKLSARGWNSTLFGEATDGGVIQTLDGGPSLAFGAATNPNSLIQTNGEGAIGFGTVESGGIIKSTNNGALAGGVAIESGHIISDGEGSFAQGSVEDSGVIQALGTGSSARGYATGAGSSIIANQYASFINGMVSDGGQLFSDSSAGMIVGYADGAGSMINVTNNGDPMYGAFAAGAVTGGGLLEVDSSGAQAMGYVDGVGSSIIGQNTASFARGYSSSGGQIVTIGVASSASGEASGVDGAGNPSIISTTVEANAAFVNAHAQNGGLATVGGLGSALFGYATGAQAGQQSAITAMANGSFATGATESGGAITIDGEGAQAMGVSTNIALITSGGGGAFARGYADGQDSVISAASNGTTAFGEAVDGGQLNAAEEGSFVLGRSESGGIIISQGYGSTSTGYAYGNTGSTFSQIHTGGYGSVASGYAEGGGYLNAGGDGSHIFGSAYEISTISATGIGAFASGIADEGGAINSNGIASTVFGYVKNGKGITASGDGSFALGLAAIGNITASGDGSFAWGHDVIASNNYSIVLGTNVSSLADNSLTVGFGSNQLVVDGATNATTLTGQAGNTAVLKITTTAGNTCTFSTTTGLFSCASDRRLKHDIDSIDPADALARLSLLNPVTYHYNWQSATDAPVPGFIAQEFEEQFPDMVSTDPQTGYKSLSYTPLIPYIVKAVQEMDIQIAAITDLPGSDADATFADKLTQWFANASNHITRIFTGEVCLTDSDGSSECLNKSELHQLKALLNQPSAPIINPPADPDPDPALTDPVVTPDPDPQLEPEVTPPADTPAPDPSPAPEATE